MKHWHACFTLNKNSLYWAVWGFCLRVFWVKLQVVWSNRHGQLSWTLSPLLCQLSLSVPDSFLIPVQPLKGEGKTELGWKTTLEKLSEGQLAHSQCPVIGQGKHWHDELSLKEWERRERKRSEWGHGRKWKRRLKRPGVWAIHPLLFENTLPFYLHIPVKVSKVGKVGLFSWWEEVELWRCCFSRQSLKMSDSSIGWIWTCQLIQKI